MIHRMSIYEPLILLMAISPVITFGTGADGPLKFQETLENGKATLYCDSTPDSVDDEFLLLVWYKDNDSMYSYDARAGTEWCDFAFNASGRIVANMFTNPTALTITALKENDQALYNCRVEFLLSATRNMGVNLTVTVLPSEPFFLDELGNTVTNKTRSYYEGDTLVLSCLVIGGRPPPKISWYSGETLVDATDSISEIPNVRQNDLYLPLNRDNANKLSCKATNTQLVPPQESSLQIELYLPADKVQIKWIQGISNEVMLAGKPATAQCIAYGSYPAPDLIWSLNHNRLAHDLNQTWDDVNEAAISYIQFIPTVSDHLCNLTCDAINPIMPLERKSISDAITLNVTFAPVVEIEQLGIDKRIQIAELDALHLKCVIKANPPVNKIMWYFNDSDIRKGGIWGNNIYSDQLVIEEVTRKYTGRYSCAARNALGETRADSINVIVLYPPECLKPAITLRKETLICNVRALPIPDTYFWHIYQLEYETQHVTTGSASLGLDQLSGPFSNTLNVSCEAENGIASQERSCTNIIKLENLRPMQPEQCDLAFVGKEFEIKCLPVENATHYQLSLWRLSTTNTSLVLDQKRTIEVGKSLALTQNDEPWLVREELGLLKAGDEASAAACNRYGCSAALLLRPSQKFLSAVVPSWWNFFTERNMGITVGVLLLVIMFIGLTILMICLTRRSRVKRPTPVIQVLQLNDITRDYFSRTGDMRVHPSRSLRSESSEYSDGNESPSLMDYYSIHNTDWIPPPDVTLNLQRESAV